MLYNNKLKKYSMTYSSAHLARSVTAIWTLLSLNEASFIDKLILVSSIKVSEHVIFLLSNSKQIFGTFFTLSNSTSAQNRKK